MKIKLAAIPAFLVLFGGAHALSGQVALVPQISGNDLTAKIALTDGLEADLSISFEQVVGLNAKALTLSAGVVSPTDSTLLARLPDPTTISIATGFPVLVRVDPSASSVLSFSGVYTLSLYTHNLTLVGNSPLRVFRAAGGGVFQDMTGFLQVGSVRAGGSGPGFSEFLIVADTRPVDAVISGKFDALSSLLSSNSGSMSPAILSDLQQRVSQARSYFTAGAVAGAIASLAGFSDQVRQQSGSGIPDVWRANGSGVNVAGLLRSAADTLKFSLSAKSNGAS